MTKYKRRQQQQRYRFMRLPVLESVENATYLNIQIKNPDIHIWHHIMLHWINLLYLSKSDRECSKSEFCTKHVWLLHCKQCNAQAPLESWAKKFQTVKALSLVVQQQRVWKMRDGLESHGLGQTQWGSNTF